MNFRIFREGEGVQNLQMEGLNKIGKFAAGGFVGCLFSYYAFQYTLSNALIKSQLCQQAIELVKNHSGAKYFLGEPIEPVEAKFSDYERNPVTVTIQMLVSGPKSKGLLFVRAIENNENQRELASVQLQIGSDNNKRLEIKSQATPES